jgi:hypothetical protein
MTDEEEIEQQSQRDAAFSDVCTFCAHWDPIAGRHCAAYPRKEIPTAIWDDLGDLHLRPRGDEALDEAGQPIVFALHPAVSMATLQAANPDLAAQLRNRATR